MKSIKPGRGPSMMGGFAGIAMIAFGIIWTMLAAQANGFFALFGVVWTGLAVGVTIYNFKNATSEKRYSDFDIVDSEEEPDPLNERFGKQQTATQRKNDGENRFCPYCGTHVGADFEYCNKCGKKLP